MQKGPEALVREGRSASSASANARRLSRCGSADTAAIRSGLSETVREWESRSEAGSRLVARKLSTLSGAQTTQQI